MFRSLTSDVFDLFRALLADEGEPAARRCSYAALHSSRLTLQTAQTRRQVHRRSTASHLVGFDQGTRTLRPRLEGQSWDTAARAAEVSGIQASGAPIV